MEFVARLVDASARIYSLAILAYAVLSYLGSPGAARLRVLLGRAVEPPLARLRNVVPKWTTPTTQFDLSPALLLLIVLVIRWLIVEVIIGVRV